MPIDYKNYNNLAAIIVNWNAGNAQLTTTIEQTGKSLRKAKSVGLLDDFVIHLWDNKSERFQNPITDPAWPLIVTRSESNLGFSGGNNQAVTRSRNVKWILLVNPDAMFEEDSLQNVLKVANESSEFAAFGFSLMAAEQAGTFDGLGDVVHASGLCWRDGFSQSIDLVQPLMEPYETFAVCAAALLIRRDMFEALGGFDEDFFCYQEDIDLGFRLRLMGQKSLQIPQAIVHHVGSQSTGGHRSDFSVYHGRRNLVWCYVKNMPGVLFWLFLPLHLALNVVELFYFTAQGQARVIWRAKWDAIKGLPKMWCKRRVIQAQRVATIGQIWQALDKRLWPWGFKSIRAKSGKRFGGY